MNGFAIGKVLEPEIKMIETKEGKRRKVNFGFLSGKVSTNLDVFEDSDVYAKAADLRDGDMIILIFGCSVGDRGYVRNYVRDLALSPDGLREQMLSLFK